MKRRAFPDWWHWELEWTPHLLRRMEDRQFNEIDLRKMLQHSRGCRKDVVEGRWVIDAWHDRHPWEVIVEPDATDHVLVVITAYPIWDE